MYYTSTIFSQGDKGAAGEPGPAGAVGLDVSL